MTAQEILKDAKDNFENTVKIRRELHANAETGFELETTLTIVENELKRLNISNFTRQGGGITALIGKKEGKCFLLRADMDALPIKEQSGLDFASKNGNMHACGHDMHTAALLSAAAILKKHEHTLCGKVKLMFQPAEELLKGSEEMIKAGVLENPKVDAAMMLHVMPAVPFEAGTIIVSKEGVSAPAADYFEIEVEGKGGHGATPEKCVDPLITAAHIVINLQQIQSRELSINDSAVLTVGSFQSGDALNVIPAKAKLGGTMRAFDEEARGKIKRRIKEIAEKTAETFGALAKVTFPSGAPTLKNDITLAQSILKYQKELLGDKAISQSELEREGKVKSTGSEDFAYVSHKVPSIMLAIAAGKSEEGYSKPLHHPQVKFDETALLNGAAAEAYTAIRWLEDNK